MRDSPPSWWNARYPIRTPQQFERDIDWLLRIAPPVSLQMLLDWKNGKAEKPKGWFLSFDDGYRELADVVAPILSRKGVPATFFLCTSLLDHKNIFFEDLAGLIALELKAATSGKRERALQELRHSRHTIDSLLQAPTPKNELLRCLANVLEIDVNAWMMSEQPYLTSDHVRHLLDSGFAVGAHSVNHPLFCQIPEDEAMAQCCQSIEQVTRQFELPYRVFAFPYGEFGLQKTFLETLINKSNADLMFGTRGVVKDELEPFLIQRMLAEHPILSLREILHSQLNLQLQRRFTNRDCVRRRPENEL